MMRGILNTVFPLHHPGHPAFKDEVLDRSSDSDRLLEEVKRKRGFYCSNDSLPVMILKRAISIITKYLNNRYITWEYRYQAPDAVLEKEGGKSGAPSPSIQVPGRRLFIAKAGSFLAGEVKEKCARWVLQPLLNLKSLRHYKI